MSNNSNDWRSSLSYIDPTNSRVRQTLSETLDNIQLMIDWFDPDDDVPREIGGLDRSAALIAELLGNDPTHPDEPRYVRRFHDDGCVIDTADKELGGHDAAEGCELQEEEEDGK